MLFIHGKHSLYTCVIDSMHVCIEIVIFMCAAHKIRARSYSTSGNMSAHVNNAWICAGLPKTRRISC